MHSAFGESSSWHGRPWFCWALRKWWIPLHRRTAWIVHIAPWIPNAMLRLRDRWTLTASVWRLRCGWEWCIHHVRLSTVSTPICSSNSLNPHRQPFAISSFSSNSIRIYVNLVDPDFVRSDHFRFVLICVWVWWLSINSVDGVGG